ncbi:hypothetical protein BS50DRAFT_447363, partial [Corynespora cassiicola Philippines]
AFLQCELLARLMGYLFPKREPVVDDIASFNHLDRLWTENQWAFQNILDPFPAPRRYVFQAWIEERRRISRLQPTMDNLLDRTTEDKVERLLALNHLRTMWLQWRALDTRDDRSALSAEERLCKVMATLTKTEGTEDLFREGLTDLNK